MKEPIIIDDSGSIDIFETRIAAELYLEAIDVKNDVYACYDAEGKVLQPFIIKDSNGIEVVVLTEGKRSNEIELRQLLTNFLKYLGYSDEQLSKRELPDLVSESLKFKSE